MKLHLSEEILTNYCRVFQDDIIKNRTRNFRFILARPRLRRKFVLLCKKYCSAQNGGFFDGLANLVNNASHNLMCKPSYPIYTKKELPESVETMKLLLSTGWNAALSTGEFSTGVMDMLDTIISVFGIFITTTGSPVTQGIKLGINTIGKVAATAISTPAGGVGSEAITIPSVIGKSAHVIKTIMNVIKKMHEKLKPLLAKGVELIERAKENIDKVNYKMNRLDQFADGDTLIRFMYDIFSVTFEGGTFQCKCWVDYILSAYMGENADKQKAASLYCFLSEIYVEINNILLDFVGSSIEMLVPQLGGIVTFAINTFGQKYSFVVYRKLLDYLTEKYHDCPSDIQFIVEGPERLKEYIRKKYDELLGPTDYFANGGGLLTDFIKSKTIGAFESVATKLTGIDKETVEKGIDLVGFAIHKCMGIIFAFLNLFVSFSEIYAGVGDIKVDDALKVCQ